jgi:NADH-quinone oxidoreductase subunit L
VDKILHFFVLLPLAGLLLSLVPARKKEALIFWIATIALLVHWVGLTTFSVLWWLDGGRPLFEKFLTYYKRADAEFSFDMYFDKFTLVYGFMAGLLGSLVALFSRYYMHRDPGYKRFFNNIMFFFLGLNLVIFSGNFETLFLGWEVLGISSFLLIGFYRERYLPVKNSIKVVSLYRLSDIGILVALWLCHAVFGRNIQFEEMNQSAMIASELAQNPVYHFLIPLVFLLVAAVKSGQFPFSSWLPRAMEGPTTSSAIFYGSLSVHIGLFLMLRTAPLWMDNMAIRVLIIAMGALTSLVAGSIANVQPTVKTQIAYASIAQIGLMFIEAALGWHTFVLVHFAGNALLRSYQLLVSPSVLNYLIHEQFYHFEPPKDKLLKGWSGRLRASWYILSVKEFNLDRFQFHFLWTPFKWLGRRLGILSAPPAIMAMGLVLLGGIIGLMAGVGEITWLHRGIAFFMALLALSLVLAAFAERESAKRAWLFILSAHLFTGLSIGYNTFFDPFGSAMYLSGVTVAGIVGFIVLSWVEKKENTYDLSNFYGHSYEYPGLGLLFLLCGLAVAGFPVSPTFVGLDIVLSRIHSNQFPLLLAIGLSFIFMEIAVLRVYARVFLGQHVKAYHAVAFRNS